MVTALRKLENLAKIPIWDLYRIGVDGYLHAKENGAEGYENREPGSVTGLFKGYAFMLNHITMPCLTIEFIKSLHVHFTSSIPNYLVENTTPPGLFRSWVSIGYDEYYPKSVSLAGLIELFNWLDKTNYYGLEFEFYGKKFVYNIYYKKIIFNYLGVNSTVELATKIFKIDNTEVTLKFYHTSGIEAAVAEVVDNFNREMKLAPSKEAKLAIGVKTIWLLEHIHPFGNGNTRTFKALLDWILFGIDGIENIALSERPLHMTGHSIKENCFFIEQSIKNTAKLIHEKQLFSYISSPDSDYYGADILKDKISEMIYRLRNNSDFKPFYSVAIDQIKNDVHPHASTFLVRLNQQVQRGNVKAYYILAFCYALGREVPRDQKQALIWLRKAVDLDHPPALNAYALYYWSISDIDEAAKWFNRLINLEYDKNLLKDYFYYLADYYSNIRKFADAIYWYELAEKYGNQFAKPSSQMCYLNGYGSKDQQIAALTHQRITRQLLLTEAKQLAICQSAIRFANMTCILGAANRYSDLKRTKGWSFTQSYRNLGGSYTTQLDTAYQCMNAHYSSSKRRLVFRQDKRWYYQPPYGANGEITLAPISENAQPLNDPRFAISPANQYLLKAAINAQTSRQGNCYVRTALVAKYLWENHSDVIDCIERVSLHNGDHTFIVVNRQDDNWTTGWAVDPWWTATGKIFPIADYKNQFELYIQYRKNNDRKFEKSCVSLPKTKQLPDGTLNVMNYIFPSFDNYPTYDAAKKVEDYYIALNSYSVSERNQLTRYKQDHQINFKPCLESLVRLSFFNGGKRKLLSPSLGQSNAKRRALNIDTPPIPYC